MCFAPALDIPLVLSEKHNGSKRVQGSIGCRFIYHTRGKVLRGIDVGVQQMSLGERAKLSMRSDYAFDIVRWRDIARVLVVVHVSDNNSNKQQTFITVTLWVYQTQVFPSIHQHLQKV